MASKPPDAFLSYTRWDDRRRDITAFCKHLEHSVQDLTGKPFEIFQDVDDIQLGERWSDKLDQILSEARFFIPIVTPSYFESGPCRDELEKFLRAEAEHGRQDLVLPIYYIDSDILENGDLRADDPLAVAIHKRQRHDWRPLRFRSFNTKTVREAYEELARQIVRARRRVMPGMAMPGPRPEPQFAAERPELSPKIASPSPRAEEFDVILTMIGDHKLSVIRQLMTLTGVRLSDAKALVEGAPQRVSKGILLKEAEEIKKLLHAAGATVWIKPAINSVRQLKPGTVFRDINAPWCPEVVVIPPGEFMMGSTEAERQWAVEQGAKRSSVWAEKPQHPVRIAYVSAVGRYPVTFEEYDHFAKTTNRERADDRNWGRGRRPVINVSWHDAKAYVEWLASETKQPYRLPSEAEWEYACRAGTTTRYSWGDGILPQYANYGREVWQTSEVGGYSTNAWGLCDMHGNIFEWVEDCWNDGYDGAPADGSAWREGNCIRRVLRGGSWHSDPRNLRSAYRVGNAPIVRDDVRGFRVARTLT
jgi:formylglycine-generating enzyme required for sulfatase activity